MNKQTQSSKNTLVTFNHKQLVNHYFKRSAEAFLKLNEVDWIKKGAFFQPMRTFNCYTPWVARCSIQTDGNDSIEQGEEDNPFAVIAYLDWPEYSSVAVFNQERPEEYLEYILNELKRMSYIKQTDLVKENSKLKNYSPPTVKLSASSLQQNIC